MGDFLLIKTNPKRAYSTFCYLTIHVIHFLHFMICHASIYCKNNKQQKVECLACYIAKSGIFSTEIPLKSNYCPSDVWPGVLSRGAVAWGRGGKPKGSSAKCGRPKVRLKSGGTVKGRELRGGLPR
jgi:hypothetical protein